MLQLRTSTIYTITRIRLSLTQLSMSSKPRTKPSFLSVHFTFIGKKARDTIKTTSGFFESSISGLASSAPTLISPSQSCAQKPERNQPTQQETSLIPNDKDMSFAHYQWNICISFCDAPFDVLTEFLLGQAKTLRVLQLEHIGIMYLDDDGVEVLDFLRMIKNDLTLDYLKMARVSSNEDRSRLIGGHDDTWTSREEIQEGLQMYIQREENDEHSVDEEWNDDDDDEWISVHHSENEEEEEEVWPDGKYCSISRNICQLAWIWHCRNARLEIQKLRSLRYTSITHQITCQALHSPSKKIVLTGQADQTLHPFIPRPLVSGSSDSSATTSGTSLFLRTCTDTTIQRTHLKRSVFVARRFISSPSKSARISASRKRSAIQREHREIYFQPAGNIPANCRKPSLRLFQWASLACLKRPAKMTVSSTRGSRSPVIIYVFGKRSGRECGPIYKMIIARIISGVKTRSLNGSSINGVSGTGVSLCGRSDDRLISQLLNRSIRALRLWRTDIFVFILRPVTPLWIDENCALGYRKRCFALPSADLYIVLWLQPGASTGKPVLAPQASNLSSCALGSIATNPPPGISSTILSTHQLAEEVDVWCVWLVPADPQMFQCQASSYSSHLFICLLGTDEIVDREDETGQKPASNAVVIHVARKYDLV
ncbi:lipase, partial [Aureobasidium melanogenum]